MTPCEDLDEVVDLENDEDSGIRVIQGELIAVLSTDTYRGCINTSCKAEVVPLDDVIGNCKKCLAKVKLHKCPVMSYYD